MPLSPLSQQVAPEVLVVQAVQIDLSYRQPTGAGSNIAASFARLAKINDCTYPCFPDLSLEGPSYPVHVLRTKEDTPRRETAVWSPKATKISRIYKSVDAKRPIAHHRSVPVIKPSGYTLRRETSDDRRSAGRPACPLRSAFADSERQPA